MFDIIRFLSAFDFTWNENYVFDGESHAQWELVFVDSGCAIATEEDRVYNLSAGQIVIHSAWEFHRIRSAQKGTRVMVSAFSLSGDAPKRLTEGVFTLSVEEREEFLYAFSKIKDVSRMTNLRDGAPSSSDEDYLEAKCRLIAFLIRLSRRKTEGKRSASESATAYNRVASFMRKVSGDNLTISEIAEQNFVSQSYMKYLFSKYAGLSPKEYYAHQQILCANSLLEKGMRISEIAAKMHFSSPNYFSYFYKKHTGISPNERKMES